MKNFVLITGITLILGISSAHAAERDTAGLYAKTCTICHATGAAGAPKTGDVAAWEPRLAQGMDTLLQHAKNGIRGMPPKGMCMDCTDAEFTALIQFMSSAKE